MKKKLFVVLVLAIAAGGLLYWGKENSQANRNLRALNAAILNIHTDTVLLNEVVPFDWDVVYTPEPCQTGKEIEKLIGFPSPAIREEPVGEDMTYLIFVKGREVVCSVLGSPSELGYRLCLDGDNCLTREENVWFRVLRGNGVIWLDDGVEELP